MGAQDFELEWELNPRKQGARALPGSAVTRHCSFGITEVLGGLLASGLGSLGVGSATAGILGTGLADAGLGALGSAALGGNPLVGAATGGLGGLGGGLASNLGLGSALGIGSTTADALGGAAGGTLGSALTGGNLLTGALTGGALGYGIGANGLPSGTPGAGPVAATPSAVNTPATGLGGGGASAGSVGLPGGGSLAATGALPSDLTSVTNSLGLTPATVQAANIVPNMNLTDISTALPNISAGAGVTAGAGGALDQIGSSLKNAITQNPIQSLNTALGIVQGQEQQSAFNNTLKQLQGIAGPNSQQAQQLQGYLQSGQLPAGLQANINASSNAQKQAIKARYAQLGLSGSTMEQQDLNAVDTAATLQAGQLATQLYQAGTQQTGLSAEMLNGILSAQGELAKQGNSAVSNYAAALAGGNYAPKVT